MNDDMLAACTLPTVERPTRLAEFDDLFADEVHAMERTDSTRLTLHLQPAPQVAARAADLAVRETGCCGFLTFTLTATDGRLTLEVAVPEAQVPVLDALTARAGRPAPVDLQP